MQKLPKKFFERDAVTVAKDLLGCVLEKDGVSGMIVETEAYSDDEASHAFTKTPRSILMHETHGHAYVYFTYGMHYCFNVTCDKKKPGAVLIRALLPLDGVSKMKKRRDMTDEKNLTNGPGKLTQALAINKTDNGTEIGEHIKIYHYKKFAPKHILSTPRIGISKAIDLHWRFLVQDPESRE
ncbi:MAG: 3-methyladenine DNA glycosylase [Candidatus Zambryskibacteria bacterium CG10_big_fil_rev_8_21_14_0_10_42_12]|uniref:Putative 3-methyladenine DNA glycosylase n=1 Tax=Candidatus Zambryskibacteria bacterium CG10_big_fil_rev_8_21_14_0_10_42_12 TaxID=1975115 RepID=A0A2H0QXS3_9BACT|nr:MAG: 3-methyladenine DNA glycosylase [Candidatus Zambryskibacteria bacterium CG10_big_fil_rev_8_21_14_0_10_42_12]